MQEEKKKDGSAAEERILPRKAARQDVKLNVHGYRRILMIFFFFSFVLFLM